MLSQDRQGVTVMKNRTHFVVYHRYNDDPESGKVPDLELDIINAGHIFKDGRLLSVWNTCVAELKSQGLSVTVTGEDND